MTLQLAQLGFREADLLDIRPEADFLRAHAPAAAGIPLEELPCRVHELPPKGAPLRVFGTDAGRVAAAVEVLHTRRYVVRPVAIGDTELTESGPSPAILWRPSPFLLEALSSTGILPVSIAGFQPAWSRRWAPLAAGMGETPMVLTDRMPVLRALDLACGCGREAVCLAKLGFEVDAIDILPDALAMAAELAGRHDVRLNTIQQDLRRNPTLPRQTYDLIAVFRFHHAPLLPAIRAALRPSGAIIYEAFSSAIGDGELAAAFAGLTPLIIRDNVPRDGRRFCQLLARDERSA